MTRLRGPARDIPGWIGGLIEDAQPGTVPLGTIASGLNFVPAPVPSNELRTRGGSRIMLTLSDDAGSPAELTHVGLLFPYSPLGAMAVGWSDGRNRCYLYRLTADMAFVTGTEATSRVDLSAAPSTTWNNASAPPRPVAAEIYEKFFLADATTTYASRNEFLSVSSAGTVLAPAFSFDGGAAAALKPYCIEEYNGVLFLAGYGDASDTDRPEMLRHSFLARSPDDTTASAEGFHKDAYLLLGAKGQRVTALRKGKGLLLAAKAHEFYRISGFGRAYPGWQYTVESVQNTTGLGIANPHGLTYAEGFWYGVGAQGPLRTDGFSVESLAGPRQRGWRAMRYPEFAAVTYHPDRKVVLFAVRPTQTETGHATTYPWVWWVWDIERERWAPDWRFSTLNATMMNAVPLPIGATAGSGTVPGPTAAPNTPVTSAASTSGWTAGWTNGDATAQTEYWEKEGSGGTWTLIATIAAGTATYARTGRTNHTQYYWKVRHRKSGIVTDYTAETSAQTLIAAPTLLLSIGFGSPGFSYQILTVTRNAADTSMILERDSGGGYVTHKTYVSGPVGNQTETIYLDSETITSYCGTNFRARSINAAWSVSPSVNSNVVATDACA